MMKCLELQVDKELWELRRNEPYNTKRVRFSPLDIVTIFLNLLRFYTPKSFQ